MDRYDLRLFLQKDWGERINRHGVELLLETMIEAMEAGPGNDLSYVQRLCGDLYTALENYNNRYENETE